MPVGQRDRVMDSKTSKALRKYAAATGQGQKAVKRDWLKTSQKERAKFRKAVAK